MMWVDGEFEFPVGRHDFKLAGVKVHNVEVKSGWFIEYIYLTFRVFYGSVGKEIKPTVFCGRFDSWIMFRAVTFFYFEGFRLVIVMVMLTWVFPRRLLKTCDDVWIAYFRPKMIDDCCSKQKWKKDFIEAIIYSESISKSTLVKVMIQHRNLS
jgi:hypothetical protein